MPGSLSENVPGISISSLFYSACSYPNFRPFITYMCSGKKHEFHAHCKYFFYLCIWSVYIFFRIKYLNLRTFYYVFDWVPALLIILLIRQITFPKPIGDIFRLLGEHSGNIFMCHSFLYSIYTRNMVYFPKYSLIIIPLFTAYSIGVSIGIERLKHLVRYDKLQKILHI